MRLLSKSPWMLVVCLSWLSAPAWAENQTDATQPNDSCYFYEFIRGTKDYSDPANQVVYFIKNRWRELEIDLARGKGDELTYLKGLARCSYELPDRFWETNLRGLPYEQRSPTFTKFFLFHCFCRSE
jgi:hypothetical protein